MKKLIFRKFTLDVFTFFLVSILIMGLIVWTLQAVNYFDFVTRDGHGLKIYFFLHIIKFSENYLQDTAIHIFYIIVFYNN